MARSCSSRPSAPAGTILLSGGPSFFQVEQDLVEDIKINGDLSRTTRPPSTPRSRSATPRRACGFNVGADVTRLLTAHMGVGAAVVISRATLHFDTFSDPTRDFDVGGTRVGRRTFVFDSEEMPMLSRRHFLSLTAAPACVCSVAPSPRSADAEPLESAGPLPPSIMALTSMRDRAKPITVDERRGRNRAGEEADGRAEARRDRPRRRHLAGLLHRHALGRQRAAVRGRHPASGNPYVVCPAFEEDRAREQLAIGPLAHTDVATWRGRRKPVRARCAGTQGPRHRRRAGSASKRRRSSCSPTASRFAAPALKVASATPVTAGSRMIKDAHEVELMRLACEATLKCYEAVYQGAPARHDANPGRLADQRRATDVSASPASPASRSASTPRCRTARLTPQTIREGTIIMIDDGCTVEGYQSDITRTLRPRQSHRQDEEGLRHRPPGANRGAEGGAARRPARGDRRRGPQGGGGRAATDPGSSTCSHRLGHGMGMDGHEWPYLVKNNMYGWDQNAEAAGGNGVQRRAGHLHSRRVRRAARGRHAHHRRTAPSCSRRRARRSRSPSGPAVGLGVGG